MKKHKLFIGIMGEPDSGKSTTWYNLFEAKVKSSSKYPKSILLFHKMWEEVHLVNGSPEETGNSLQSRFSSNAPRILLSSLQYIPDAQRSLDYIDKHYDDKHIFWLNPDHRSKNFSDPLGFASKLFSRRFSVHIVDGRKKNESKKTAKRIKALIHGWSVSNM